MTFDDVCGVTNPHGITFNEKMDRYIKYLRRHDIRKYLPAGPEELARQWLADEHFNAMPLKKWEEAAGYPGYQDRQGYVPPDGSGSFPRFLRSKGITEFNMSECVCVLKRCAELEARDYLSEIMAALPKQDEPLDLEIWAVFEHCSARTDKANRFNIFDFDCTAAFRDEDAASRYESMDPGRRVKKLVRIRNMPALNLLKPVDHNKDKEDGDNA